MDLVDFILWLSTTGELKHLVSLFNWWEPFSKKDLLVLVQWIFHNWWSLNHHFYLQMLRFPIIPFSAWRRAPKTILSRWFFDPHFFYTEKITWVCCWIGKKHLLKGSWKPGNSGLLKPSILRVPPPWISRVSQRKSHQGMTAIHWASMKGEDQVGCLGWKVEDFIFPPKHPLKGTRPYKWFGIWARTVFCWKSFISSNMERILFPKVVKHPMILCRVSLPQHTI